MAVLHKSEADRREFLARYQNGELDTHPDYTQYGTHETARKIDTRPLPQILAELEAFKEQVLARLAAIEAREREREGDGK